MIVEMKKIPGLQYTPMLVSLKNDTSEKFTIPVKNVSKEPIIIIADKDLFMLEPVIDVQCQVTTTSGVSPENKKVIKETELSQVHKKEFEELLSRYPNLLQYMIVNWVPLT